MHRIVSTSLAALPLALLTACSSLATTTRSPQQTSANAPRGRALALVADRPLTISDVQASLIEAAGAAILEEHYLDAALAKRLQEAQRVVTPEDVERERALLRGNIQAEAQVDDAQAQQLLDQVRASRGLGPTRFDALLRRNAALRALVQDSVTVTPEQEAQEFAIAFQPRTRARYFLHERESVASSVRSQVLSAASPSDRRRLFGDLAAQQSQDSSAPRGGLLAPISLNDPSVPLSIRQALSHSAEGDVSDVLAVPGGFAVVLHDGVAPADRADTPDARAALLASLRMRLERLAMDDQAQRILREARVTILDDSLAWSWQRRNTGR